MKLAELFLIGQKRLAEAGIDGCQRDVELLLEYSLNRSRSSLLLYPEEEIPRVEVDTFLRYLARREQREPLAYIVNEQEFWSLPFYVDSNVLIPRPETEFLLETVFNRVKNSSLPAGRVLDLCCGSGIIAVILARELNLQVLAADISEQALAVTKKNSQRHQLENMVLPVRSDLFSAFPSKPQFSLIVSNPPYVSMQAINQGLQPEVAWHEPILALNGGQDGMEIIHKIYATLPNVLVSGGQFFMEFGFDQSKLVKDLFSAPTGGGLSFSHVEIHHDYAGLDRVLHAVAS